MDGTVAKSANSKKNIVNNDTIQIVIKSLNSSPFKLTVSINETIANVMEKIDDHVKDELIDRVPRLMFNGKPLLNFRRLSDYNIKDQSILYIAYDYHLGSMNMYVIKYTVCRI